MPESANLPKVNLPKVNLPKVNLFVDGRSVSVPEGSMVSAAVAAAGGSVFRRSVSREPRAALCGMGICFECRVTIDGEAHARSCQIPCRSGMEVWTGSGVVNQEANREANGVANEGVREGVRSGSGSSRSEIQSCDVLVIGGGPAGMAAASSAAESGLDVVIADDNPELGGQIWRGEQAKTTQAEAALWLKQVQSARVRVIGGARIFDRPEAGRVVAETTDGVCDIGYRKLILATGARERFLPFPGWTLPGVCGAGGLQALVKSGLPINGRRVVVAGSGPLLMAVAAYLRGRGAEVLLVAEQAPWSQLMGFGAEILRQPRRARQALKLKRELGGVPYLTNCWPVEAKGDERLKSVTLQRGGKRWEVECDYLACGFHLVPNVELALLFGCELDRGAVRAGEYQETSAAGVYAAGEATGVGGLELSIAEGRIAGYAAAGREEAARGYFHVREKARRFARVLERTFALRDELKMMAQPETIVCRCEDVSLGRMRAYDSWRAAKLQTRCGMGPCQGRICGAAAEFLLGWGMESVRPPVFPVRVDSLAAKWEAK